MNQNYNEFAQQFRKPDGSTDWGKAAAAWLEQEENNQLSIINNRKIKSPKDLPIFNLADELSDDVWDIVLRWDWFAKKTVGDQWVRATDSIAANIAEGYGRYFFGEYILFLYYARGSAYEAMFWLEKARRRQLLIINNQSLKSNNQLPTADNPSFKSNNQLYEELKQKFDRLPVEINKVVKVVKSQSQKWKGRPRGW